MKNQLSIFFTAILFLFSTVFANEADYVFTGGKVYTLDEKQPWAEAVAVQGKNILYVGNAEEARKFIGEKTKVIDTTGKVVMPGFVSAHDHLIAALWTNAGVHLYDVSTKEEALKKIKEWAEANPDEKVIKGIGWSAGKFGGNPTAKELDTAVKDRPAIILDFTIHDAWLNSKALEMGNITKDTPDTLPGTTYWVRDEEGNPTGAAIEVQWMQTYIDLGAWEPDKMIKESTESLTSIAASNGNTTFQNPGVVTPNVKDTHGGMEEDFETAMKMLRQMEVDGTLKTRTFPQPIFKNIDADPQKFVDFVEKMNQQYNTDILRVQSMKIHPEGNWNAEVAPFIDPYESGKVGSFNVKPETIKEIMTAAAEKNLDVSIHSDSDGSARAAIDGILEAKKIDPDNRNSIHHAVWIHPDDQKRIIENKIPLNVTPAFSNDFTDTDKDALRLLGEKRVEEEMGKYPDLAREGVNVSLSADYPSTPIHMQAPLFQVEAAVTLMDPSNPGKSKPFPPNVKPMSVEDAIRSITIDAAWQLRMEDKIGSLEAGKYADIVVIEENPFEVDPEDIAEIDVSMTMMDGKFTYVKGEEEPEIPSGPQSTGTGWYPAEVE